MIAVYLIAARRVPNSPQSIPNKCDLAVNALSLVGQLMVRHIYKLNTVKLIQRKSKKPQRVTHDGKFITTITTCKMINP